MTEAISRLADMHVKMERYFQDNKSYAPPAPAIQPCQALTVAPLPAPTTNFTFACAPPPTANTYVVTATGIGPMAGFVYTLDQNNNRASTGPAGWTPNPTCWLLKRDGSC
ncbi:MAG: type IV pilin protein [Pseudomonadota bacterium]|nr:type IV pilin protein [Pseudomonadota bacterium]